MKQSHGRTFFGVASAFALAFASGIAASHFSEVHGQTESTTQIGRYQGFLSMGGDRLGGSVLILDTATGEGKVWSTFEGNGNAVVIDSGTISFISGQIKLNTQQTISAP